MQQLDHPDTALNYYALKQIQVGSKQATTTAAMNAMWEAIEAGKSKEEAEEIYCSFFNKADNGKEIILSVK